MLNSNKSTKVAHFQKVANQSVLNGALVIETCRLIKRGTPKIYISTLKN